MEIRLLSLKLNNSIHISYEGLSIYCSHCSLYMKEPSTHMPSCIGVELLKYNGHPCEGNVYEQFNLYKLIKLCNQTILN